MSQVISEKIKYTRVCQPMPMENGVGKMVFQDKSWQNSS